MCRFEKGSNSKLKIINQNSNLAAKKLREQKNKKQRKTSKYRKHKFTKLNDLFDILETSIFTFFNAKIIKRRGLSV